MDHSISRSTSTAGVGAAGSDSTMSSVAGCSEVLSPEVLMQKLESVSEVRSKALELEEVRRRIDAEVAVREREERCLEEYRRELELLQQEKMAHVEELRLIHSDMDCMERTMKSCKAELSRAREQATRIYEVDYRPLREQVERMRGALGLGGLGPPPLPPAVSSEQQTGEDKESCPPVAGNKRQRVSPSAGGAAIPRQPLSLVTAPPGAPPPPAASEQRKQVAAAAVAQAAAVAAHQQQAAAAHAAAVAALTQQQGGGGGGAASGSTNTAAVAGPLAGFGAFPRQQPPPMKSCLSCHQQIHRNAPICPLCKAKSRSRHPKKPKHKTAK